jgi:Zn-dependent metalloprotease
MFTTPKRNFHHSVFCLVPPHVLENIEQKGSPEQRRLATRTLDLDGMLRSRRQLAARVRRPFRAARRAQRMFQGPERAAAAVCDLERTVFDAGQMQRLPGKKVRSEGQEPTGDAAVDEAYDALGHTFALYQEEYGRCSIDDEGLPLDATVHYGVGYDNAFWDGQQMVFGDGDENLPEKQRIFNRFTISLDVIGHELTHGVTEHESGLVYYFQAGALNEHISDVFGSLVKQRAQNQTADAADWLIGEGLLTKNVNGVALRSMKEPGTAYDDPVLGKDPQPGHMDDYVRMGPFDDNGGVHVNSGIPNKAFYLVATNLGGSAWEKAGHIWYETCLSPSLRRFTNFVTFAGLTVDIAGELYGEGSDEQAAVEDAWGEVGVL